MIFVHIKILIHIVAVQHVNPNRLFYILSNWRLLDAMHYLLQILMKQLDIDVSSPFVLEPLFDLRDRSEFLTWGWVEVF